MVDDFAKYDGMTPHEALLEAVRILGSQAELARIAGVSGTAVWKWVQSSKRVPGDFVLAVEEATGIPCYVLCPSTYPPARFRPPRRFIGIDQAATRGVVMKRAVIGHGNHRALLDGANGGRQ